MLATEPRSLQLFGLSYGEGLESLGKKKHQNHIETEKHK